MQIINNGDGTSMLKNVQVWCSGTYRGYGSPKEGDKFDAPDLDSMVDAFHNTRLNPRFYFGHPLNKALKQMARPQGKLIDMRRIGDSVYADVDGVPNHVATRAVADDVRLSPDMQKNWLDPSSGKNYPWVITGLAALGAIQPGNVKMKSLGEQLQDPVLDPDTHYAFSAHCRSFYGGQDENTRSFVVNHSRFRASDLDFKRIQHREEQVQAALARGETRSFALGGGYSNPRGFVPGGAYTGGSASRTSNLLFAGGLALGTAATVAGGVALGKHNVRRRNERINRIVQKILTEPEGGHEGLVLSGQKGRRRWRRPGQASVGLPSSGAGAAGMSAGSKMVAAMTVGAGVTAAGAAGVLAVRAHRKAQEAELARLEAMRAARLATAHAMLERQIGRPLTADERDMVEASNAWRNVPLG